jgi:hypothetical protein
MNRNKWQEYLDEHNENWKAYNIRHIIERLSVMPEEETLRKEYVLKYRGKEDFWDAYIMNRDFEREAER